MCHAFCNSVNALGIVPLKTEIPKWSYKASQSCKISTERNLRLGRHGADLEDLESLDV